MITTTSAGVVSLTNYGFCTLTAANVTRIGTNSKAYTITFPSAHPNGNQFIVMAVPYTQTSASWDSTLGTDYVCTTSIGSDTSLNVWCRRPGYPHTTGMVNGSLYCYTVP